ncbi:hypothetical protein [Paraclostridium sp. AKS73]|uniref:hypothetical protein n=1 Tax=Paraclostridium sp. AKS73 TaxID=2876116 RepID=UPI0021E0C092|nr:hypothetical protein [Paraclostridium sp. AKS73]MCU9816887.1 hypothetical protein [Paraclostridium sp. AKS73]
MKSISRFNVFKKVLLVICACMLVYNGFNYSIALIGIMNLLIGFIFSCETYFAYKDSGKLDFKSFTFALVCIVTGLISIFYY